MVGERQMDKHAMQSEVGYLLSGYGREEGEREEQREEGGEGKGMRLRLQAGRRICLPQQMGREWAWLVS